MAEPLLEALPDLIVLVRREGTVIACAGGGGVGHLKPTAPEGQPLESFWPAPIAQLLKQLIRKAIATRAPTEARFEDAGVALRSGSRPGAGACDLCHPPHAHRAAEDSLDLTDERPAAAAGPARIPEAFQGVGGGGGATREADGHRRDPRRWHSRYRPGHCRGNRRTGDERGHPATARSDWSRRRGTWVS